MVDRDNYISYLSQINISPYFLADNRQIYSDHLAGVSPRRTAANIRRTMPESRPRPADEKSGLADELAEALWRTSNWLRSQIISATAQGSVGADAIYLEVLSQLATSHLDEDEPSIGQIKKRIEELELRTRRFNEFGLVPSLQAAPFIKLLDKADRSTHARASLIEDVLTPYLDGQRARLDSLQPTESLIRTFVETVNSFLFDKQITYSVRHGLRIITTDDQDVLGPQQLSSGERQLLLLLCNSLLSLAESALFIIDEPEISLNAKWQRKLIPALLACVQAGNVQFILATHSVEIITGHREFLARLRAGG